MPGVCYGAILPEDLSSYNEANQLKLTPIKIGMLKNHGYSQIKVDGYDAAVVGCEEGVFVFAPPAAVGEPWTVKQVLSVPTSDAALMDFDGDGKLELGTISPFHGASRDLSLGRPWQLRAPVEVRQAGEGNRHDPRHLGLPASW